MGSLSNELMSVIEIIGWILTIICVIQSIRYLIASVEDPTQEYGLTSLFYFWLSLNVFFIFCSSVSNTQGQKNAWSYFAVEIILVLFHTSAWTIAMAIGYNLAVGGMDKLGKIANYIDKMDSK